MYVFYFVRYHSGWKPGRYSGLMKIHEHFPLRPALIGAATDPIEAACGVAVARLGPLLFLPGCSGGFLRCRIQGDLGPGSLALQEGVVSCRA